ncbi:MAG: trigger factor [Coriobacteriia bacterium]|nr:trigger factor [Coriobacteriia bacterium]
MLTTKVEPLEGNHIKLTVTVPVDQVDEAVKKAYDKVTKQVRIPGFRKGHAPRPVVDNYLGKEYVLTEATEVLVESTYALAIAAESISPIESPEISELDVIVPGEEFTYSADVEVRPELTLTHTDGISVTVPPKLVSDSMIEEQVESAREHFATLAPVEGRPVQANDFALISFVGDIEGEPFEGNVVDQYLYQLNQGAMPTEFDDGLLGIEVGETKRIEFALPENTSSVEYIGKIAGFEVTVHEIKEKALPEVDDEFAEQVGGYDNVAAMYDDLRVRLQASQTLQNARATEEALRAAMAERLEGEVPQSMIDSKTKDLMRELSASLEQQGMTVQAYIAALKMPIEALEADLNRQGEQSVREELALEALFRAEGMEVTDEDVVTEMKTMISGGESVDEAIKSWTERGLMSIVREQIVRQKAIKWLVANGEITEDPEYNKKAEAAAKAAAEASNEAAPATDEPVDVDTADTTEE